MVNKRFWLGILVIVLVLEMMAVSCDNGSKDDNNNGNGGGGKTDFALNGIWVSVTDGYESTYDNGNWVGSVNGILWEKGTYTTDDGKIIWKRTHMWGKGTFSSYGLDTKWYTQAELQSAILDFNFNDFFTEHITIYSISGNTLTTTEEEGGYTYTRTLTKK
jgi:hypothetical protein